MDDDDGVALQATNHPLHITDEMVAAGRKAFDANWKGHDGTSDMVKVIFTAMVYAAPPEPEPDTELNEEFLEHAVAEVTLHNDTIERFAIRCARGNNGGEWLKRPDGESHYTEEQKERWRQFVRELADEIMSAPKQVRISTSR